jgi:hypothetical protein
MCGKNTSRHENKNDVHIFSQREMTFPADDRTIHGETKAIYL